MSQENRKILIAAFVVAIWLAAASAGLADVNYDFVKQDGEVESKLPNMVQQVCNVIIGVGLGLSIIAVGIGACQFFGRVFKMDKETGMEKVKGGIIGILAFGVFWAIIATAFKIAGI